MARLTRDDWVDAAYARFTESGIAAVAVEPIARALGATKGSFYWHFADRQALLDAVVHRWRTDETERLIDEVEQLDTAQAKLARLFQLIAHRTGERTGERTLYADAAAVHVREPVEAATERRVSYVAELLQGCGIPRAQARQRAIVVVAAVIGYQQLITTGWDPSADPRALIDTLYAIATAGHDTPARTGGP